MQVSLSPEDQKYLEEQVKAGRYGSVEEFLTAAVAQLRQADQFGDFSPGELDQLIAEAETEFDRGEGVSLEAVRDHFARRAR